MRSIKFRLFYLVFFVFATAFSQSIPLTKSTKVSILTCDVGNEVYSLFGHTAIRIKDPGTNLDLVYNYGTFDFRAPNFIGRFTKGDLQYFVAVSTFNDFMYQYVYEKRSVVEQELNLPHNEKQRLFEELNMVLASDQRFYTYKFIDRNCTNMTVAILNKILGNTVIKKTDAVSKTYREVLYPYFNEHFYEQLGTSIIFGTKVDQEATRLFLPDELMRSLERTNYKNESLALKTSQLLDYPKQKSTDFWWNNIFTYLIALGLIVWADKKVLTNTYFVLLGSTGLFFSIAGLYSYHEELAHNYNALLFNPLLLLLVYFNITGSKKWVVRTAISLIICAAIYLSIALFKVHFWIVLPIFSSNLLLLHRQIARNK